MKNLYLFNGTSVSMLSKLGENSLLLARKLDCKSAFNQNNPTLFKTLITFKSNYKIIFSLNYEFFKIFDFSKLFCFGESV